MALAATNSVLPQASFFSNKPSLDPKSTKRVIDTAGSHSDIIPCMKKRRVTSRSRAAVLLKFDLQVDFLSNLPSEITLHIFSFLPPLNIPLVRNLCRKFNNLLTDELFWRQRNEMTFGNLPPPEEGILCYSFITWSSVFRDNLVFFRQSFRTRKDPFSAKGPRQLPSRVCFAARFGYTSLINHFLFDLSLEARKKLLNTWTKQQNKIRATALYLSSQHGNHETAERLCILGSDPNSLAPENESTALFAAASAGHHLVVRTLHKFGADLNRARKDGASPLLIATRRGHIQVVKTLLELGCDINLTRFNNLSAIYLSVVKGEPEMVKLLLNAGATLAELTGGASLLFVAAYCGHHDALKVLLEHGLNPNSRNADGATPAYGAAFKGEIKALEVLRSYGADLNLARNDGKTPLAVAVQSKHKEVVKWLIERDVDLNRAQQDGSTPLFSAVRTQDAEVVRALLTTPSPTGVLNVNQHRFDGVAPINVAAQNGDEEITKLLLGAGADPNIEVFQGLTPIVIAADKGHVLVAKSLVEAGANVNHQTLDGTTPLYLASQRGYAQLVEILLNGGADPNIARVKNEAALHAAAFRGFTSIVKMLLVYGADSSVVREDGVTPLILAVHVGKADVTQILLEAGAVVEAPLKRNSATPLTYAAAMSRLDLVTMLLQHGANPDHTLTDGKTSAKSLLGAKWEEVSSFYNPPRPSPIYSPSFEFNTDIFFTPSPLSSQSEDQEMAYGQAVGGEETNNSGERDGHSGMEIEEGAPQRDGFEVKSLNNSGNTFSSGPDSPVSSSVL
jgi:ankyrin repeat protein